MNYSHDGWTNIRGQVRLMKGVYYDRHITTRVLWIDNRRYRHGRLTILVRRRRGRFFDP